MLRKTVLSLLIPLACIGYSQDTIVPGMPVIENEPINVNFPFFTGIEQDTVLIDSFFLDGIKDPVYLSKFSRKYFTSNHGGTFDFVESGSSETYLIRTKQDSLLFACTTHYAFKCANFNAYHDPTHYKGSCSYRRSFKYDKNGVVTLGPIHASNSIKGRDKHKVVLPNCSSGREAGTYQFASPNGYLLIPDK